MATTNTEEPIRNVYDQWHRMVRDRNVNGLMELYAADSVLESSAVLVIEKDDSGTLRGRDKIKAHSHAFFEMMGPSKTDWYRPGSFLFDRGRLLWEYPSKSPHGQQLDVVESMDIENGLIFYHRVYWGWIGFKTLLAATNK